MTISNVKIYLESSDNATGLTRVESIFLYDEKDNESYYPRHVNHEFSIDNTRDDINSFVISLAKELKVSSDIIEVIE